MTEQHPSRPRRPGAPDPWKSFRGVMAGTLILEAIVVLLALPVVAAADHGLTPLTAGYLIGFAVVLVLLAGVQGRPWAIWVNLGIQVVLIAGWVGARRGRFHRPDLHRGVAADRLPARRSAAPAERGLLPGQQSATRSPRTVPHRLQLSAVTERTLVLIKPDGVKRRLIGEILSRIEGKGLTIAALELKDVGDDLARRHYAEHEGKPFFASLLEFITSGPVVAAIVEGPRAVAAFRQIAGATDPVEKAAPGTIRGDLALITQDNLVHGSDSPESAVREIELWFPGE